MKVPNSVSVAAATAVAYLALVRTLQRSHDLDMDELLAHLEVSRASLVASDASVAVAILDDWTERVAALKQDPPR